MVNMVEQLFIDRGEVKARVMTEHTRPYEMIMRTYQWNETQWDEVLNLLTAEAANIAALLNDQWPASIEEQLNEIHLTHDLTMSDFECECTCTLSTTIQQQTGSQTCDHIGDVYERLISEINAKPLLFFRLKGMDEQQLLAQLRERRSEGSADHAQTAPYVIKDEYKEWNETDVASQPLVAEHHQPLFWNKEIPLYEVLRPVYSKVSERARRIQEQYSADVRKKG